jgi:hypothetical protein
VRPAFALPLSNYEPAEDVEQPRSAACRCAAACPSPTQRPFAACPVSWPLQDQLDSLPYLCRFQYAETAEYLTSLTDPLIAAYQRMGTSAAGAGSSRGGRAVWWWL